MLAAVGDKRKGFAYREAFFYSIYFGLRTHVSFAAAVMAAFENGKIDGVPVRHDSNWSF